MPSRNLRISFFFTRVEPWMLAADCETLSMSRPAETHVSLGLVQTSLRRREHTLKQKLVLLRRALLDRHPFQHLHVPNLLLPKEIPNFDRPPVVRNDSVD